MSHKKLSMKLDPQRRTHWPRSPLSRIIAVPPINYYAPRLSSTLLTMPLIHLSLTEEQGAPPPLLLTLFSQLIGFRYISYR
jgi:hypothetical protein